MRFFTFLALSFFYIPSLFAQSLSPNPWVKQNTKEQIQKAYQKRDNLISNSSSQNQALTTTNKDTSFLDSLKQQFSTPKEPIENTHIKTQKRIPHPSKFSSKRRSSPNISTASIPTSSSTVKSQSFSLPTFNLPSFSIPSNSFFNKTKQNFKNTLNQIKKQIN